MAWFKRNRDEAPPGADDALDPVAPQAAPEPAGSGGTEQPGGSGGAAQPDLTGEAPATGPVASEPAAPAWTTAAPMPSVVPTIQRMLGKITAQNTTTLGKPAPLALAPLGHAVTPDAPAGVVTALSADPASASGALGPDQPPLEYVQRAPVGAVPGRPAPPAQLLVPAFQPSQPSRPPSIPTVPPAVQRAPDRPSFTTAPPPEAPLVLPVGEILPPPAPPPAADAPSPGPLAEASAPTTAPDPAPGAPLLTGPATRPAEAASAGAPDVQRSTVAMPLAPVQRHADHPGHVDGDDAPAEPESAAVQRAPVDAPAVGPTPAPTPAAAADAPLLADAPLTPAAPLTAPDAAAVTGLPEAPQAPEVDLPLAPVQRHADHPGHVDGDDAPADAPEASDVSEVQRAAADATPIAPQPPLATAPLVGDAAPLGGEAVPAASPPAQESPTAGAELPLPGGPVQRSAAPRRTGLGRPIPSVPTDAVPPGTVQRAPLPAAPTGSPTALPAAAPPGASPTPTAATAPLVGSEPLRPAPSLPLAAVPRAASDDDDEGDRHGEGDEPGHEPVGAATSTVPTLDLAQRAPVEGGSAAAVESATGAPAASDGDPLTAPLLGQQPIEPTIGPAAAADPTTTSGALPAAAGAVASGAPASDLDLVQRAPASSAGSSAPTSAASTPSSSSSATTPTAATAPLLVVAPLLGGRPFSTHVQRTADGSPVAASAPAGLVDRSSPEALSPVPGQVYQPLAGIGMWNGAPPPDLPGPAIEAPPGHVAAAVQRATGTDVSNVRIRRDTGPTAQRLAARAFTHEGEVHIPSSVGSLDRGEGASLATHELVHAGQQSVLGSSRPHEHTPEGQHLEAQARSAEHASLAGIELPKLPLVPPAAPAVQRAPSEGSSSSPFSPQQLSRLIDLADNPPTNGATVQRAQVEEPVAAPPPPSMPAPDSPSGGAPEHHETPQELEELASKLFPTLRNLFRGELLAFRRRSGTSSDRPLS